MRELSDGLRLHHIGFAVRSLEESCRAFEAMGARLFYELSDAGRNLDFQFLSLGGVILELVAPHDASLPCSVTRVIEKQPCTPYHICLETPDLEAELQRLRNLGFRQVCEASATESYGYKATGVFLLSKGTGLVELVQEGKADGWPQ